MSVIKGTLATKDGGEIKEVYPRTTASMVLYGDSSTVDDVLSTVVSLEDLEGSEQRIIDTFNNTFTTDCLNEFIDRSITSVVNNKLSKIGTNAFANCYDLATCIVPNVTVIEGGAFNSCSSLTNVDFSNVTSIGGNGLYGCTKLTALCFPKLSTINTRAFCNCTNLSCLILLDADVASLITSDAFNMSAIGRANGYIYVPDELVEDYKVAENWSAYSGQIKGLSELPEEYYYLIENISYSDDDLFVLGGES